MTCEFDSDLGLSMRGLQVLHVLLVPASFSPTLQRRAGQVTLQALNSLSVSVNACLCLRVSQAQGASCLFALW